MEGDGRLTLCVMEGDGRSVAAQGRSWEVMEGWSLECAPSLCSWQSEAIGSNQKQSRSDARLLCVVGRDRDGRGRHAVTDQPRDSLLGQLGRGERGCPEGERVGERVESGGVLHDEGGMPCPDAHAARWRQRCHGRAG